MRCESQGLKYLRQKACLHEYRFMNAYRQMQIYENPIKVKIPK